MNQSASSWQTRALNIMPYAACALVLALYQLLYVNGYYPVTEGWFSEYARLIRTGLVPYRDFYLLVPPLYSLQLAAFQSLFGEGLFALRLFGVVVTCAIGVALLDLLRNFFKPWSSAFAAAVAMVLYQSGVAYLGYDFTQFLTLYILIAAALLVRSIRPAAQPLERRGMLLSGLSGLFLGLAVLIKQSNATIAALILIVAAAGAAYRLYGSRGSMVRIGAVAIGAFVPVAITLCWLAIVGALPAFFNDVISQAAKAKGGAGIILLSWVWHYFTDQPGYLFLLRQAFFELVELFVAMVMISAVIQLIVLVEQRRKPGKREMLSALWRVTGVARDVPACGRSAFLSIIALALLMISITATARAGCVHCENLAYLLDRFRQAELSWSINFYFVAFVASAGVLWRWGGVQVAKFCLVMALGIGLTFGNGTSGGISEISMFLGIAVFVAFVLDTWAPYFLPALLPVALSIWFCTIYVEKKMDAPYSWWLLTVPHVQTSACADAQDVLRGICMPEREYGSIERIDNDITANSTAGEAIYVYPHMPIFYLMTNRPPYDRAVVSWFDFMSDRLAQDVARRLRTDPPAVIVMAEIPNDVLVAHEQLFRGGKPLIQRDILASIGFLQAHGMIKRVDRIANLNNMDVDVYRRVSRPVVPRRGSATSGATTPK